MKIEKGKPWFKVYLEGRPFWTKNSTRHRFFYTLDAALSYAKKVRKFYEPKYQISVDYHCPHKTADECCGCSQGFEDICKIKI